jgi:hypothetical protein
MLSILFNSEAFSLLSQVSLIPETRWNQSLQAKTGKPVFGLQRSDWLRFLLKIYLESEISVGGSFRRLISQTSKRPIIFFSVSQDFSPRVMAMYRGVSVFLLPPLTPNTHRPAIRNVPPKGPVSLEAST